MLLFLVPVLATPADAYVDPGTGSLLLQIILGGLTGFFLYFWTPIRRGLSKVKGKLFRSRTE